jgi:hypothetical protein
MVVVALGEPGTPVVCWAMLGKAQSNAAKTNASVVDINAFVFIGSSLFCLTYFKPILCINVFYSCYFTQFLVNQFSLQTR